MFIGHFAVGFAAKRAAPTTSLGLLLAAPLLLDLLWPVFLLAGWERVQIHPNENPFLRLVFVHYPISHSLVVSIGWGALFGVFYWMGSGYRAGAVVIALAVVSHWFFDALVHIPDLPLYPGGPLIGLGLWRSVVGAMIVEGLLFAAGVWTYMSATAARDRTGRYAAWAFVILLLIFYVANLTGPPPPSARILAIVGLSGSLLPVFAAWLDRHRLSK